VIAGHTYQAAGTYSIKVTIGNYNPANPLGDNVVTVFSTANVDPFNMNM
jgi:type IV secretory pathway VirB4 component